MPEGDEPIRTRMLEPISASDSSQFDSLSHDDEVENLLAVSFDGVVRTLRDIMDAKMASIALRRGDELQYNFSPDLQERKVDLSVNLSDRSIATHVYNDPLASVFSYDVYRFPRDKDGPFYKIDTEKKTGTSIREMICCAIPNPTGGDPLGVVNVMNSDRFVRDHVTLVETVSRLLGNMIVGARFGMADSLSATVDDILHQAEELAHVSKEFHDRLNAPPELDYAKIEAFTAPFNAFGGDFYHFTHPAEDEMGIVLFDIEGHGQHAMHDIKPVIERLEQVAGLQELMKYGNENEFLSRFANHEYATSFTLGYLTMKPGELAYTGFGHDLPLIYNLRTGERVTVDFPTALNYQRYLERDEIIASLPEVQRYAIEDPHFVLLFTDGAFETKRVIKDDDYEEFGHERIDAIVQSRLKKGITDPRDILLELDYEQRAFSGPAYTKHDSDDITMIGLYIDPVHEMEVIE